MYGIHIPSSRITFNLSLFLFFFFKFLSSYQHEYIEDPSSINLALEGVMSNHLSLIPSLLSLKCSRKTQRQSYIYILPYNQPT